MCAHRVVFCYHKLTSSHQIIRIVTVMESSLIPPRSTCTRCSRPESSSLPLKTCSGCRSALYCSTECQRSDWSEHKKACLGSDQQATELVTRIRKVLTRDNILVLIALYRAARKNGNGKGALGIMPGLVKDTIMVRFVSDIVVEEEIDETSLPRTIPLLLYLGQEKMQMIAIKNNAPMAKVKEAMRRLRQTHNGIKRFGVEDMTIVLTAVELEEKVVEEIRDE
jgi:MYND finger